jgi:hypothetical protein
MYICSNTTLDNASKLENAHLSVSRTAETRTYMNVTGTFRIYVSDLLVMVFLC